MKEKPISSGRNGIRGWQYLLLAFAMFLTTGLTAQRTITGTVTDDEGVPLIGASILVQGTSTGTITDFEGNYSISAGEGDVMVFSYTGYETKQVTVGSSDVIDVELSAGVALDEVIVTGYTSERKADIIGSVSVVRTEDMLTAPAANLTEALQGRASGVVVSNNGQPGSGATVRIRGFTSFGNSSPLYVIDGVPTDDPSKINPQDIASVQVLKDATAASIYGARAAQGVVIITTKKGTAGVVRLTYDGYVGTQTIPESTFPDLLNTSQYLEYLQRSNDPSVIHPVFGELGSATIPDRIIVSNSFRGGVSASDPRANPALYTIEDYGNIYQILETSPGTNWFDEVTQSGLMQSHQVTASGGTEQANFSLGFNYFNQEGALVYTGYDRYAVRLNSEFKPKQWLRLGENVQVLYEEFLSGDNRGEASGWAQAFRMVPYIPVYDIQGGWGGNGVGESGNGTSPIAQLFRDKDDDRNNWKVFGNVYAEIEPVKDLVVRTSFGLDYGSFIFRDYILRTYERSENVGTTGYQEQTTNSTFWTWTNTLSYGKTFGRHNVRALLGTEAVKGTGTGIIVNTNTFDFEDPDFITLNTDQAALPNVNSPLFRQTLSSVFGRLDYTFNDKYLINATVRRDGSSKFGSENRYAVFPAFGAGWRVSAEPFMQNVSFINDLKIRGGWGQMGSERVVDANNQYTIYFSNVGVTNYDIGRTQNSLAQGYTAQRVGSNATKWETSETTNVGFDASLFGYKLDVSFNWFNNDTKDLLVQRIRNGLEPIVQQPFINIGKMRNRGFDLELTTRGNITSDLKYDFTLTFTHYKNTVIDIDGNPETFFSQNASRLNNVSRTQAGHPIASFYGYQLDGFFNSQAEVDALEQDGAVVGGWKYKDLDGNGMIDDDDRTFIGSPHPDFIAGFNLGLTFRNFDLSAFFIWNQGNKLYNYTKYFTDMRVFVGGVSTRVLNDGWTPENPNASLPRLAPGTQNGYTSFTTSTSNDYYVEDGSYLRARTIQLGYTLPNSILGALNMQRIRLYLQGQNLFTVTNYQGADPDINLLNVNGNDLSMGIDETGYPNPRQLLFGLSVTF